jgi:hypothetical protein
MPEKRARAARAATPAATGRVARRGRAVTVASKPGAATGRKAAAAESSARARRDRRPATTIFISYRHQPPSAEIAQKLYEALAPAADTWGAEVYMDRHAVEPGGLFDREIVDALDRTTHFVALLNNSYWGSDYCRKEIARVVERFERGRRVRLLFVKAEEFDLAHFSFDRDRQSGRISSRDPIIDKVGDLQFLGPFNAARQLERLAWEHEARLGDQLAALVKELERVVDRTSASAGK